MYSIRNAAIDAVIITWGQTVTRFIEVIVS